MIFQKLPRKFDENVFLKKHVKWIRLLVEITVQGIHIKSSSDVSNEVYDSILPFNSCFLKLNPEYVIAIAY